MTLSPPNAWTDYGNPIFRLSDFQPITTQQRGRVASRMGRNGTFLFARTWSRLRGSTSPQLGMSKNRYVLFHCVVKDCRHPGVQQGLLPIVAPCHHFICAPHCLQLNSFLHIRTLHVVLPPYPEAVAAKLQFEFHPRSPYLLLLLYAEKLNTKKKKKSRLGPWCEAP